MVLLFIDERKNNSDKDIKYIIKVYYYYIIKVYKKLTLISLFKIRKYPNRLEYKIGII